jgi:hypothetical protein
MLIFALSAAHRNIMYQMMQLKMHVSDQSYVFQEMVPSSQQPPEGGCWAPFSCSWGLKDAPRAPVRENATLFNTAGHLPVAHRWHSCSPSDALQAHTNNWSHVAEEKSYWCWKIAERCQLRRRAATVRLLCDRLFRTARHRHSENFNDKLKLVGASNGTPAA